MDQGEVVLHEPEQLYLTFVVRMVNDKQVNGIVWEGVGKGETKAPREVRIAAKTITKMYLKCHIDAGGHRTNIERRIKKTTN